jgi:hypothetical protein
VCTFVISHPSLTSEQELDPFSGGSKGRLFWPLLRIFGRTFASQALVIVFHGLFHLLNFVGTNQLSRYLETGGVRAVVRHHYAQFGCASGEHDHHPLVGTFSPPVIGQFEVRG